ncbi:YhcH/YjgK/YiaL family protein [Arcticibacter tournemirensis]
MKRYFLQLGILFFCVAMMLSACSSVRQTEKWFMHGKWYNGMKLYPHVSVNRHEFESQYNKNKAWWDSAFKFLKETDFDKIAPGKYPLDGNNVYVNVTVGPMRDFENTKWEAHRHTIDLQYTYKGTEKMGVAPVSKARVIDPYNEKKDVAIYDAEGKFYLTGPDTFFLFFPGDAHRPNIKVDEDNAVKKIVVKIRYTD